jgi:teichoic acid transport system permease protein
MGKINNKVISYIKPVYTKKLLEKEKIFEYNGIRIKYIFDKKKILGKNKLIVVFSGFRPANSSIKASYNYTKYSKDINCHKLYILDDTGPGGRGCYYLGENREFTIEKAVCELIEEIRKEHGVSKENVTTCGSSKGGWAALYFGIKYKYGHVVSGAPQTLLGSYLNNHKQFLKHIAGGISSEDIEYLNRLLYELRLTNKTKLNIHVSKKDSHYINHIVPFINHLRNNNIDFVLDIDNYNGHSETGIHFGKYLTKNLLISKSEYKKKLFKEEELDKINKQILINRQDNIENKEVEVVQKENNVYLNVNAGYIQELDYAYYIMKDKDVIEKIPYSDNNNFHYIFNIPGSYKIRIFIRNRYNSIISILDTRIINIDENLIKTNYDKNKDKVKTNGLSNNIIIKEHIQNINTIIRLAKFQIKRQYSDSVLGSLWVFLKPTTLILMYGFVFGLGIRGGRPLDVNGETVPFFLWYLSAIIPWFFIRDAILQGSVSLYLKSNIITQIKFPLSIIPTYTMLSLFIIHLAMLTLTFLIYVVNGFLPDIYYLQLIYYMVATLVFLWGLSMLTSAITIVIRDFNVLLNSVITGLFLLTPIMWSADNLKGLSLLAIKINPIYYLVQGYRNTFLYKIWFWEYPRYTLYFWGLTLVIVCTGMYVHKVLRPIFVDRL